MEKRHGPFTGIKVIDLTRVLAGPYTTMVLADLGAEVLKVETPGTGDDSRHFGPFINDVSGYFYSINRGKESITLNLKDTKAKEIFFKLVETADVVIENYRPGTTKKLGIDYEELKKVKADIIYAACSGFGHSGPYSRYPAYDMIVQAMGGIMSITGPEDGEPVRVGTSVGDITAALFTAIGISSALFNREKTGHGAFIDVAMLDSQLAILENAVVRYIVSGIPPKPLGTRHPSITPFQAFHTKDSNIIIAVGNDKLWVDFCRAIERPELIEFPEFETNDKRTENARKLIPILEDIIKERTTDQWLEIFERVQVPAAPVNDMEKVLSNPQLLARNMIVEAEDKRIGVMKMAGNPIKMNILADHAVKKPAPVLGEHTEKVLLDLGYSKKDIETFRKNGII